ncbi:hypothetical protein Pmani_022926 [Petrolisthes manimaculis]|uniref:C2 domain-containing protein n=1 Tax=Petrolisthes manimaculis TaxID=1843537 RepID=A0AAE1U3V0_9EUCA|nr:hypothetical protein Pmani_022926 [Petrolisthes manimaculis]
MNEDITLLVAIHEGRGISARSGWSVVVTAQLDGLHQSTDPVPLTSHPKFNVEVSWTLSTTKLRKFKQNLVPLKLECVAVDNTSNTQHTLGYVILQLHNAVKGFKTDAQWHRLLGAVPGGGHKVPPALQLSLNVISTSAAAAASMEDRDDLDESMEVDNQQHYQDLQILRDGERTDENVNNARGGVEEEDEDGSDSVILDGMNTRQGNRGQIQRDRGGGGGGGGGGGAAARRPKNHSIDDEEDVVEVVGGMGRNHRSRATVISSPQTPTTTSTRTTRSAYRRTNYTSNNHSTFQPDSPQPQQQRSLMRRSSRNATTIPVIPIKENGHSGGHKRSTNDTNDMPVVLSNPSTTTTTTTTTRPGPSMTQTGSDCPRLVPRLNNSGGFFQIGPAGEPDEQTFNFSVTIVYAKHLNQVVPSEVQMTEGKQARFCYSLLGHVVNTDPIKDLSNPDFLAERAGGKVVATTDNVSKYFTQHPQLPIHLLLGDVCLATANVDLAQFGKDVLRGEGPMKVEGQYPLLAIMRDPLALPTLQPILGVAVTLSITPKEKSERYQQPLALQENVPQASSLIMVDLPSSSSNSSSDSDSDEDLMDRPGNRHGHKSVALTSRRLTEATSSWKHDRKSLMYEAAMEMETWKEGQQQVFWQQWSAREADLQRHLAKEWESRVNEAELHLHRRLDQCQALHRRLTDELVNLDQMERNVARKEDKLKTEEEEVALMKAEVKEKKKQLKKYGQAEREPVQIGRLKQQLLQERQKRRDLMKENRQLEAANAAANRTAQVQHLGTCVKSEEIESLKTQVDQLQEEVREAKEKKQHYKERWIKATSQLHQLLSDPRFRHHHQDLRMDVGGRSSSPPPPVYIQSHPNTITTRSLKYREQNDTEGEDTTHHHPNTNTNSNTTTRRATKVLVKIESEDEDAYTEPRVTRWRKDDRPGKSSSNTKQSPYHTTDNPRQTYHRNDNPRQTYHRNDNTKQMYHHTTDNTKPTNHTDNNTNTPTSTIPTSVTTRRSLLRQNQHPVIKLEPEPEDASTEPEPETRWRKDSKPGKSSSDLGTDNINRMVKSRNELMRLVRNRGSLDDEVASMFPPAIQEAQKKIRSLDALDDR